MKIIIKIIFCTILIYKFVPFSYASEIKEDKWWKNEKEALTPPLKISVIYLGYPIPGRSPGGREEYTNKLLSIIKEEILEDVVNMRKNSKIGKIYSNGYLSYLRSGSAGIENFESNNIKIPIDCGYIILDKNNYIDAFPLDNACKWLLYSFSNLTNENNALELYLWSGVRPIPEVKGSRRGVRIEFFERNDPYYAQGLIRYLEQEGFRIKAIEEGVKLDSIDYKAE
ncbi:MAG: hypothetical protein IPP74_06890 [Alphaproteobacteria bacterium]|nr:hypothetical protein [Alphaproteobacteria bacterium]